MRERETEPRPDAVPRTVRVRAEPPRLLLSATVLSPAAVGAVQRTAGNRATTALLTPAAVVVQRQIKLTGRKRDQYLKAVRGTWGEDGASELLDDLCRWCVSTTQLDQILALGGDAWDRLQFGMSGEQANEYATIKDALAAVSASSTTTGKAVDPYLTAKQKLRAQKIDPRDFEEADLAAITAGAPHLGWAKAIENVQQDVTLRKTSAALAAERVVRYSAAKAAGDLLFPAGLIRDVWLVAYSVATSGSSGANTTVAVAHPDAAILPVVAAWRQQHAASLGAGTGRVHNFHVPGGGQPIQDKSTRPVNPDPTRGRQADFISTWGNTDINVHVDAIPAH